MEAYEEQDYTKKFDLDLWKRLFLLVRPFWRTMLGVLFAMVGSAAIDIIYPLLTRYAIDKFVTGHDTSTMPIFVAVYAVIVVVHAVLIYAFIRLAGRVENGVCHLIRQKGFERLQQLSFSFYDTTPIGFLMARLTSDTQRLGDTIGWAFLDLVWGSFIMLFAIIAMLSLDWKLALIVLAILPVLVVVSMFFQRLILKYYRKMRKTNSRITSAFNEGIMGAKTTKTLVREDMNYSEFQVLTEKMRVSSVRVAFWGSLFMPLVMSLGSIATAYAIWMGGNKVLGGVMTFGTLSVFISYTMQFFEPVREISRVLAEMQSAQAAAERVISMIETEPDIHDSDAIVQVYGDQFTPKRENWPEIQGHVTFDHVTFRYKNGEEVLHDFSLDVPAGQTVALVGHTGSGKSTIVNLLCRFYEPTEGVVQIDDVDYRERSQLWLQSSLGYVLQSPHLFSGSVRENIRYGRLDATDQEVEEAARLVGAEGFILKLEKGYETDVGEGGNRLSTGQKQLVSFARAILANPRIFVLDEATSSIDTETEQLIQTAIERILKGRTSFIIAHRLSTIRHSDCILVIDKGMIQEKGTHAELIALHGRYYDLYTNQFQEDLTMHALGGVAEME